MRKIIMMTAVLFSLAAKVNADCELDPAKSAGKWLASIPAALLTVDASQPADTSNYIAQFDSPTPLPISQAMVQTSADLFILRLRFSAFNFSKLVNPCI